MAAPRHYLDYNAAAPLRPAAQAAMRAAMDVVGNPSSIHAEGRAARRIVEDARTAVAALVGAAAKDVVFVSGGTEANALALAQADRVVTSAVEHDSVADARPDAAIAPVDRDGVVATPDVAAGVLLSVMAANNETGVVQPISALARAAQAAGARLHCDAAQAPGKLAPDALAGAHYLTLSSYKVGGPAGVGALILRGDAPCAPQLRGGGQERYRRAGGENLVGIAGFGAAAAAAQAGFAEETARIAELRDRLEAGARAIDDRVEVAGAAAARLPNTSCLILPETTAETAVIAFDLDGVALSAGAACSSGKLRPSRVLQAMGYDAAASARAIRVSLGWASDDADVDAFLAAFAKLTERQARRAA